MRIIEYKNMSYIMKTINVNTLNHTYDIKLYYFKTDVHCLTILNQQRQNGILSHWSDWKILSSFEASYVEILRGAWTVGFIYSTMYILTWIVCNDLDRMNNCGGHFQQKTII